MRKVYASKTSLIVIIIFLSAQVSRATFCANIFEQKTKSLSSALFHEARQLKEKKIISPDRHTLLTTKQFLDRGHLVQVVHSEQSVSKFEKSDLNKPNNKAIKAFCTEIAEALKEQYPRRNWDTKFIKEVGKNLEEYFFNSTFVVIRNPVTYEISATLRLITAPYLVVQPKGTVGKSEIRALDGSKNYAQLPVEKKFLGHPIEREQLAPFREEYNPSKNEDPDGHNKPSCPAGCQSSLQAIHEISSFTIKKGQERPLVAALLFKYFLYSSFFPNTSFNDNLYYYRSYKKGTLFGSLLSNPEKKFVYAYGDRTGRMMYSPYDFHIIDSISGKEIMGSTWNALASGDAMFKNINLKYSYQKMTSEAEGLYREGAERESDELPKQLDRQYNPIFGTHENKQHGYSGYEAHGRVFTVLGPAKDSSIAPKDFEKHNKPITQEYSRATGKWRKKKNHRNKNN